MDPAAPDPKAITPALLDRFRRDWRAVTGVGHDAPVLVALSGGGDSSALLLMLAALGRGDVVAATVDHGLRPAAAAEAAQAAALAAACGVPHVVLRGAMPGRVAGTANLSQRARALRYDLLEAQATAVGARWIATAHHADDQLETLAMRLARGAGLRGLAGIRARQGRIVRPLLGWRRVELTAVAAACGVTPVADPSNVDDRYDRARMRKVLARTEWIDAAAAVRSAAALAEAEEAIGWTTDRLLAERCRLVGGEATMDADGLPAELRRRLVERCLRHADPDLVARGAAVGGVLRRLDAGEPGTIGRLRYDVGQGGIWRFRPAPPRASH